MENETKRVFHDVTSGDLSQIRQFVRETATSTNSGQNVSPHFILPDINELIVAVNEAAANIIRHGYQGEPGSITIRVACRSDSVKVTLLDNSPPFNPITISSPDMTLPLAERPFGGMGIHMMREFCDEVTYRRTTNGENKLTLLKRVDYRE